MECGKCEFKTTEKKIMSEHLEKKHKISNSLEYSSIDFEKRRIDNLDLLMGEEERALEQLGKIVRCEFCNEPGIKETITEEDIDKVTIVKPADFYPIAKTTKGFFPEGEGMPEWVCEDCCEKESLKMKYWKDFQAAKKMQASSIDECGVEEDKLLKASPFILLEWMEGGGISLQYKYKGKKEGMITLNTYGETVEWDNYLNSEKLYEELTEKKKKEIEAKAIKLYNDLSAMHETIMGKNRKQLDCIAVDYDEGYITLRKVLRYRGTVPFLLFNIEYEECDNDESVAEVLKHEYALMGTLEKGLYLETYVTSEKLAYTLITKPVSETTYIFTGLGEIVTHQHSVSLDDREAVKGYIDNLRKLLTGELYEVRDIIFNGLEFHIIKNQVDKDEKKKYVFSDNEEKEFIFEYRPHLQYEPYTQLGSIHGHQLQRLIFLYEKQLEWLEKINPKIVLTGRINRVGENSRHIILDKSKGLALFAGHPEMELDVKITYESDKITIQKLTHYNDLDL